MKLLFLVLFSASQLFAKTSLNLNVQLNPAGSFDATSESIEGVLIRKNGVFTAEKIVMNIMSLKTGIDLRDEHLWKHLNSSKFSSAQLTNLKGENGKATAMLQVAGVTKPISITFKDKGGEIAGTFHVNAHDFKLPEVEYMGIGVDDEVKGSITMPYKEI